MTHVHYKFSSKLSYDTVVFDGPHITLRDLKRQIMGRERLRAGDCDLQITNAQSKEEYTDDEGLIPKGSSVIVRRIPVSGGKSSSSCKTNNIESSTIQFHHACGAIKAMDGQSSSRALPFFSKMANLAEADVSEEDKIKVMLDQSTYDCMNYNKKFGAVLPANYTCYRCGNTGHHIRNCPTSGQDKNLEAPLRIKKSTGIPRSFMVEVDDPNMKGAMLTNSGRYAIPAIDAEAYAIGKKEKPPFIQQEKLKSEAEEDPVPDELLCLICRDLMSDAVVIPCCGNSYCDDCIRTTLLDSEEHVCPTCSQSDVSPDTLIANKFLRQAVNNFKKERGYTKSLKSSCGASKSQNLLTTRPSPVPTPPPITRPSQPQKPHQPTYSQQIKQDSLQHHPNVTEALPLSGALLVATGPTSACSAPSTAIQPEQSYLEVPNKEAEEKTQDDSAPAVVAAPSVLVSEKEPTASPSQLIPVIKHTIVAEQPQTVRMNQQQSSSSSSSSSLGATPSPCGPPTCWDSSSSSSGHPTRGWTESQQLTSSSSSYSATTPPLFPSPLFLSAHQPHHSYPPGYQPTTPFWPVPSPQGAPIPSLCSSTSTTSIPSLIPDEWYRHQRKKNKRSPHRGSTYRRSTSRSNSKSSKSKSSHSYSNSSSRSRSRSRSRSQSRSRHQSSHSRHRDLHTRSYSYGYKRSRSPTPSSSSSPQVGYYSRSKSPSDHQKKRHHSRHQNKKPSSSSCNPRRRGERSERERGGSEAANHLYAQHTNQTASADLDRERYLQWKNEYKEWCDKYFSSYVGHFHQLPLPLLNLPPPPLPPPPPPPPPPQWVDRGESENHSHANSDSRHQPQGRHAVQMDGHSTSSQSCSNIQTPSQSSSGSNSTTSHLFSDSTSSPSSTSNNSHSPPSQSSSDGRSTPSEDGTQSSVRQQKYSHLPVTLSKEVEEDELQERSKDDKEVNVKNLEDFSIQKHDQRKMKRHEEGRREESSSPAVVGSTDDIRKDEKLHSNRPNAYKDGTSVQGEATISDPLKSIQPFLKPNKSLDKTCERESREQRNLKVEKGWRRGSNSHSRQDVEIPHKGKPSREADRVDTDRYRSPGDRKNADTRSDNNRKRKGEELERNETQRKSKSPNLFDRKKQKNEKKKEIKTQPLTVRDIWEEGIKVKPQKKISININLDGKREKHDQELSCYHHLGITGKTKGQDEKTGTGEDKLNKGSGAEAREDFSRDKEGMCEEKLKPGEANKMWEKSSFREVDIWDKIATEEEDTGEKTKNRVDEDFDLWHCALRGLVEEKEREKMLGQRDEMKASKGEEVSREEKMSMTEREGEVRRRNESQGQEMAELVQNSQKEGTDGKSMCDKNREILLEELKTKREEVKRTIKKEENTRYEEQMSTHRSHRDRPNTAVDDGSRCMDHQERRTVVKTPEDYTQDRATVREGERLFIKAPLSKWDKVSGEEEQDQQEGSAQDDVSVCVPPSLVVPTNQETETENEQKRWRSVDTERNRDSQMQRGRYLQKDSGLSSINRTVAPSSGKYRTDSTLCTDTERERKMELKGWRDRERRMESERPRDRQKENKRSKEKMREDDRGRYWGSEREHSSAVSDQRRNHSFSGPHSSSSESNYFHPSGKVSGSERKERSSISRAVEVPDKNAYKIHRDASVDSNSKDRNLAHDQHSRQDSSRSYHHQDRPAGTHHSTAFFSHTQGKNRDTLSSESFGLKPRMSPGWELMQNRSRNESKEEKGEWKLNKVNKVMRESKSGRETREIEAEREGGSRWVGEANKLAVESKWEEKRELEEGERSSSRSSNSSSSVSLEYKEDDRRKGRKKHKKHRKEKRRAVLELLEDVELKKHKKSKKHLERSKEESGGEVDDSVKEEEEDHTRLFSVMLS